MRYLFVILTLLAASVFAQDTTNGPCDAYAQMLRGEIPDVTFEEFSKCETLEQISVSFRSWPDYMFKYRANFSGSGYPIWFSVAYDALSSGDELLAFAAADSAITESTIFFANLGDHERAALYLKELINWRNEILEVIGVPNSVTEQLSEIYPTLSNNVLPNLGVSGSQNLFCLMMLDAHTVPLDELLNSATFQNCIR